MQGKKKLLIITDTPLLTTGLGRICREISGRLCSHFEVAVGGWHHLPLKHQYNFHIYPVRKGTTDETAQVHMILNDFMPDVVLAIGDLWDFSYFSEVIPIYKDQVKPVETVLWTTVDGEYLETQWAEILRNFDSVASFSHYGVEELKKYQTSLDFKVIYPGVDPKVFYAYPDNYKWGKQSIINVDNTFTVLVVGQNTDRKNIPASIEAFTEFTKDKPDTLLFMITDPKDSFGFNLWQIIKRLKLGPKCVISRNAGPKSKITDAKLNLIYNMSTVLLNTSIGEGLGMPLMEAQAANCVPVGTNYSAIPEIISDRGRVIDVVATIYGEYGVKRAYVSHKGIVRQLTDLYDDWKANSTLIKEYNEKGRDFSKKFTWERTVNELINIIGHKKKERSWVKEKIKVKDMKMLQVIPSWGKNCGIAEYSKELIDGMEKVGEKVSIFPSNNLTDLVSLVKDKEYNVVVFQHEYSFFQDRFLLEKAFDELRKEKVKIVVELHTYSPLDPYNNMVISKADEIIVHCDMFKKELMRKNDTINNISVVSMGCKAPVDFDLSEIKKNLGIEGKHPIIGSFGFMRDQKGYKEIASAVKDLKNEYPDIRFLLVAPKHEFGSKSYVESFYRYIEDLGISDNIIIIREYMEEEKLLSVLACADMFVLNYKSSRAGGGNSAAIKTIMRVQRVILASDTMYFADLKNEIYRMNGVEPDDIKSAIKELYEKPGIRKQYVEREKNYLLENSWENVIQHHLKVYTE